MIIKVALSGFFYVCELIALPLGGGGRVKLLARLHGVQEVGA